MNNLEASYLIVKPQILAVTFLFLSFAVVSTDGSRWVTNEIRVSNEINMHESEELPLRKLLTAHRHDTLPILGNASEIHNEGSPGPVGLFPTRVRLKKQMPRKKLECADCGKQFSRPSHLEIHYRSHSGIKPFSCHVCGMCFSVKCNLERHQLTHLNIAQE